MEKILVVMPCAIGDIVLTTPILRALKIKYPGCRISYALQKGVYSQVLYNNPNVDEIIYLSNEYKHKTLPAKYIDLIKSEVGSLADFDKVISFREDDNGQIYQNKLNGKHIVYYFAQKAGVEIHNIAPEIFISEEYQQKAKEIMAANDLKPAQFIVVAPYNGMSSQVNSPRVWEMSNYVYIINALQEQYGLRTVLIGANHDRCLDLKGVINVMGEHLHTVGEIISQAKFYFGVDSGVTHMASAFNVPIVDILYPGLAELWHPSTKNKFVIFSSKRLIRRATTLQNCKKEVVLESCMEIVENKLKKNKFIGFYPWS